MTTPLVSIIIPAYNAARFLPQTIQSCLDQTYQAIEIIVVDDGSEDNTAAVVQAYPQVKYIWQSNAGPARARNQGMQAAQGEFLQFLDADDILLPTKIARNMQIFQAHPEVGVVYVNYQLRSEDLAQPIKAEKRVIAVPQGEELRYMLEKGISLFGIHCALIRAEIAHRVGGFDEEIIITEDFHFWVKVAALGVVFHYTDEVLVWYRYAEGSLSSRELRLSHMRLKAYEHLRGAGIPTEYALEEKIANRYHAHAMMLWHYGRRAEARTHFRQAIECSLRLRRLRRFLIYATYVMTSKQAGALVAWLAHLRKRLPARRN